MQSPFSSSSSSPNASSSAPSASLQVGSVAGIGIYLHWTFVLLMAGLFGFYLYQGQSVAEALVGLALIVVVFACVVLHELGHALTARRFGVRTQHITLYPIGGVAQLQRLPSAPKKELWIALAGPAVNVALAAVLAVVVLAAGASFRPAPIDQPGDSLLATLMWLNLGLAAFNLLPAFPMDGGRVLRAVLATQQDYARATRTAATVGRVLAALFAIVGLVTVNIALLLVAFFVYLGAQQEAQQAMTQQVTRATSVREAMMTRFATLAPGDTLGDAVHKLLAGPEHDLPVVDDDGVVTGVLRRRTLVRALSERGRQTHVAEVMEDARLTVPPSMDLDEAFRAMRTKKSTIAPVVDPDDGLVGLLTVEQVGDLVMVASAMDRPPGGDKA